MAEGEAKYEAARARKAEAVLSDFKEEARDFEYFRSAMANDYCALVNAIGVNMDAPPAVLDDVRRLGISAQANADLKREADRMRAELDELRESFDANHGVHCLRVLRRAEAEADRMRRALAELVRIQKRKRAEGPYVGYDRERVAAWAAAAAALSHQADDEGAVRP